MKTFEEIENAVTNIIYYADKINELAREQFNYDVEHCEMITEATNRLDLLGAIGGAASKIKLLCEQMTSHLKHAQEVKLPMKQQQGEEDAQT